MAIQSIALTPRERFELSDTGVLTSHHIVGANHRHVLAAPPSGSQIIQLATSDESLFCLLQDGSVWRSHAVSQDNFHQLSNVPLGTTFIATTQHSLQFLHGSGSAISSVKLPGDGAAHLTDTGGLTGIIGFAGDEAMRAIVTGAAVYVQDYDSGVPELIPAPDETVAVEIGEEFIYFRDATGFIYRSKNYRDSGFEVLPDVDSATTMAIRSDHVDDLYFAVSNSVFVVPSESWSPAPAPGSGTGWVIGVGTGTGKEAWITGDWVAVG